MRHTRTSIIGGPLDGVSVSVPSGTTAFTIGSGPAAGSYEVTADGAVLAEAQADGAKSTKQKATARAPKTAVTEPPQE